MAEVWRGIHRQTGVPVAVKVLSGARFRDPFLIESFRTEARSVARLHHSSIILLYDYGEVGPATEAASDGRIAAGSPFLVMELATGGTLAHHPPRSWPELASLLGRLLDALAHAHARGVIHRDIKPSNVLISVGNDVRPGLKLTDFGSAHAIRPDLESHDEESLVGTATYMPPEQIRGKIRDSGPWTDLYGIGVLAWVFTTGHPPFRNSDIHELFRMHLRSELPELLPRFPVPEGFEAWLHRMLKKNVTQRFRRAADAAWALEQVAAAPELPPDHHPSDNSPAAPARTLPSDAFETLTIHDESTLVVTGGFSAIELEAAGSDPISRLIAPFPASWARSETPQLRRLLAGAGLGVYGLRSPPLVGRFEERDRIWSNLERVVSGEGPRMLVIEGPTGLGTTRLAEWITERAHELGAVTIFRADHSPIPSAMGPLRRMVETYLRTRGLSRTQTRRRISDRLSRQGVHDDYEAAALTEMLTPGPATPGDEGRVRLSGTKERYALLQRLLHRHSRGRPVILLLDDLQWGLDSIAFAQHLLTTKHDDADPLRVLILGTARTPTVGSSERETQELREVLRLTEAELIHLGPLAEGAMLTLVDELLGLSTELARQVVMRADGNPTYAIQLVSAWVDEGVLVPTVRGFELASAGSTRVPDDIHQVWMNSLARVLEPFGKSGLHALELAAVLGRQVDIAEWRELAHRTDTAIPEGLLDALASRGLVRQGESSWSFAHALLRESVERIADDAGRRAALHETCVEMLLAQGAGPMRLGRHMVLSGNPEDALGTLLHGADIAWSRGEYGRVAELLALREHALERSEIGEDNAAWGQGWIRRARLAMRHGDIALGRSLLDQTEQAARRHGWDAELAESLASQSAHYSFIGDHSAARKSAEEAVSLAQSSGDLILVARASRSLGQRLLEGGQLVRAEEMLDHSRSIFEAYGDEVGVIQSDQVLFGIAKQRGQLEQARAILLRLVAVQEQRGYRWGLASAVNGLGDLARAEHKLEEAEAHYRRAAALFISVSPTAPTARSVSVNLALVLVEQDRFDEAGALLDEAASAIDSGSSTANRGLTHMLTACCAAGAGRWESFDTPFLKGLSLLTRIERLDIDLAVVAEHIGLIALGAGQGERAVRALTLAQRQWEGLGRTVELKRTERLLDRCRGQQAP